MSKGYEVAPWRNFVGFPKSRIVPSRADRSRRLTLQDSVDLDIETGVIANSARPSLIGYHPVIRNPADHDSVGVLNVFENEGRARHASFRSLTRQRSYSDD